MIVRQITTLDEGPTNPKRGRPGITLALRWGDVCDPYLDPDGWFGPEKPRFVLRFWSRIPLPWISWNLWGWRGYLGWKIYGVDSDAYRAWIAHGEIYQGSRALCLTARLRIRD